MLTLNTKVILLGLINAALVTGGFFFQKLNAVRSGNVLVSGWLVAAAACLLPTFFIGNFAMAIGGRMSVFVSVTALSYMFVPFVARIAFDEPLGRSQVLGAALLVAGICFIAR